MLCLSGFELYSRWVPLKSSKQSQSETSETFSEFECIRNVLFMSKIKFLKVKSTLNPDELRFTNGRR